MTDLRSLVHASVEARLPGQVDTERLVAGARAQARQQRSRARGALAAAAAALVVALAGVWPDGRDAVVAALGGPGPIVETPCSDVGYCTSSFTFAGRPYTGPTCTPVRTDVVSDEIIARGRIDGERTEVRRLKGIDPSLLVAVRRTTTGCDDVDQQPEPWSLAVALPDAGQDAVRQRDVLHAVCAVVLDRDRYRNRCGPKDPGFVTSVDRAAPLALYDPVEWPSRLDDLECLLGTIRFRAAVPAPAGGWSTLEQAAGRMEATVLDALSAPGAAHTSTVAYREATRGTGAHEELFFRGDGIAVAYGTVKQATDGTWVAGYVGCVPPSAIPADGTRAQ